ncbi:MAG: hypothetical protein H7A23_05410 [Leptospiraceae bacterium]|nr:hypothetical protein [Leptospiraceae bacterium]MCP5493974.1 hypothetical protein [Leptospiraceae bacterium]
MKTKILLILLFTLLFFHCVDKRNGEVFKDYYYASLLLGDNNTELYQACSGFYASEASCVAKLSNISDVCNTTEFTRLKEGISPAALASDTVLTDYYRCWATCNTNFNEESNCKNEKFLDYSDYRSKQRSEISNPYQKWRYCFAACNNGQSIYEGLTGTTYPNDPF